MSDTPQGPGWWQASDDKWYPPPRPAMPGEAPTASPTAPTAPVAPPQPPYGPPPGAAVPPPGAPSGGFPTAPPASVPPPGAPMPGAPSPYGGMPPVAPPGAPTNRTPLFVTLGVLVTAALVGLYFLVANGDGDDEQADDPPTTQPSTTVPDTTEDTDPPELPANDGPVKVLETGFSNYDYRGEPTAAYGFIVENTGDDILQTLDIEVIFFAAGDDVITAKNLSIGTLRPGERMGLGDELYGEDLQGGLERIEVQIGDVEDAIADPESVPEGTFEVGEPETAVDDYKVTTTFHASWTYTAEADIFPTAVAIYRDAGGKIVGATSGLPDDEGSESDFELLTWTAIPGIESTEIYIEPGYIYTP